MAYTPTGKPVGRPKTKDYKTISLKMSQELLDRVQTYARLHRQSISELIRDGLEWRITDGDPRALGVSPPQRALSDDDEYSRNTVIPDEVREASKHAGMLEEIRIALTRQETQLHALTQALEQRTVASASKEYSGNTELQELSKPLPLVDTLIPFDADLSTTDSRADTTTEQDNSCNTVLQAMAATAPAPPQTDERPGGVPVPSFDPVKHHLGKLCTRGHEWGTSGQSLRANNKAGYCLACNAALNVKHKRAARKRQAQPA